MDAGQWPQGVGLVKVQMEGAGPIIIERKARPLKDQALNCPRCNSTNTKFCYYNNYSLSQPRYFCKTCRRYWTEGGSLRNVPVGGGSRKNKRSSSSSITSVSSTSSSPNQNLPDRISTPPTGFPQSHASQNPKIHQGHDLNLAYFPPPPSSDHQDYTDLSKFIEFPHTNESINHQNHVSTPSTTTTSSSTELLKGRMTSRELGSFMSMPLPNPSVPYSGGLTSLPELKPTLSFSMGEFGSAYGRTSGGAIGQGVQETGARVLFPLEELKPHSPSTSDIGFDHNRGGQGFWNGMLGGGSW